MTDPRRLLDDPALDAVQRRALVAGRDAAPPPELGAELWTELAAMTGTAVAGASSAHAASALAHAAATGKLGVLKALALGAAVGAVTTGGAVAVSRAVDPPHREPVPSVAPVTAKPPRAVASRHATDAPAGATTSTPESPPSNTPPATTGVVPKPQPAAAATSASAPAETSPAPGSDQSTARDEARLVGLAREMLARRDPSTALVMLNEAERRYPAGILLQEREALRISTLSDLGRKAEAAARAEAFLRAFPNSPHAARVARAIR